MSQQYTVGIRNSQFGFTDTLYCFFLHLFPSRPKLISIMMMMMRREQTAIRTKERAFKIGGVSLELVVMVSVGRRCGGDGWGDGEVMEDVME